MKINLARGKVGKNEQFQVISVIRADICKSFLEKSLSICKNIFFTHLGLGKTPSEGVHGLGQSNQIYSMFKLSLD